MSELPRLFPKFRTHFLNSSIRRQWIIRVHQTSQDLISNVKTRKLLHCLISILSHLIYIFNFITTYLCHFLHCYGNKYSIQKLTLEYVATAFLLFPTREVPYYQIFLGDEFFFFFTNANINNGGGFKCIPGHWEIQYNLVKIKTKE